MSIKKAQKIVNEVEDRMGISLVSYPVPELEWLSKQLEELLDTEIDTEELSDPQDLDLEGNDDHSGRNPLGHDSDFGEDDEDY